ncbi:hypothetical protein B0H14DRAFT_3533117 [Mycena olivaceomarginata]|nr:hypothetical protein B0H14DRAFT_3533117 [Mycena olivaceomarginata]
MHPGSEGGHHPTSDAIISAGSCHDTQLPSRFASPFNLPPGRQHALRVLLSATYNAPDENQLRLRCASAEANTPPNVPVNSTRNTNSPHVLLQRRTTRPMNQYRHRYASAEPNTPPEWSCQLRSSQASPQRSWFVCAVQMKDLKTSGPSVFSPFFHSLFYPVFDNQQLAPIPMYRPYISAAARTAHALDKADSARQSQWLENAIADGPLPTHEPCQPTGIADPADEDPPAPVLRAAQGSARHRQSRRRTPHLLPTNLTPSGAHANTRPRRTRSTRFSPSRSGFKNVHESQLPLCPHYANPRRTEFECRMRPRSHQRNGETFVYLQVPKNHHKCSFIAVVRPCERRLLHSDPAKRELQDEATELVMHLTTPPNKHDLKPHLPQKRDRKGALRRQPAAKGSCRTPSSTSIATARTLRPPPYSLPAPSRSGAGVVDRYTDNEARLNMVGDEPLMALTRSHREELLKDREYPRSFCLYVFGGSFATRVIDAGPVGPRPITQFIFCHRHHRRRLWPDLHQLSQHAPRLLWLRRAFHTSCFQPSTSSSPATFICVGTTPRAPLCLALHPPRTATYSDPVLFAVGRHPAHPHSAPYREFGSLTALGIALSALNTKLGLPDDVFQAVRLGLIPCVDCGRIRTVHAHLAHSPGGVCLDVGERDSSFISSTAHSGTLPPRLLLSLSGDVPTSSDEEVGHVPLGPFGRQTPCGTQAAAESSSEEYYSTSSTSSGGSSTRDLDLKAALWTEYQKRPEDVLSRFRVLAEHSSAGHDYGCPKLGEPMERCHCSRKQARIMRRKDRQEQRVARWFAAKRLEEAGADADDEGEE